jgi:hypothetical protein
MIYGATGLPNLCLANSFKGSADFGLEDAIWTLQSWPLSLVDWPTMNSQRIDIFLDPEATRR